MRIRDGICQLFGSADNQNVVLKPHFLWDAFLAVLNPTWQGQGPFLWALTYPVCIPVGADTTVCCVLLIFVSPEPNPEPGSETGLSKYLYRAPPGDCEPLELWADLSPNSGPNSDQQAVNVLGGIFQFSWTKTSYR